MSALSRKPHPFKALHVNERADIPTHKTTSICGAPRPRNLQFVSWQKGASHPQVCRMVGKETARRNDEAIDIGPMMYAYCLSQKGLLDGVDITSYPRSLWTGTPSYPLIELSYPPCDILIDDHTTRRAQLPTGNFHT